SRGGNVRQLTHESLPARHPTFSPDGTRIAYDLGSDYACDTAIIHLDGSGRTELTGHRAEREKYARTPALRLLARLLRLEAKRGCDWYPVWGDRVTER
ncbi:MAG TPA: hypothetical protein VGM23_05135, partial [Armatimonadota bacterium]